jgi:hypothetical protein
MLIIASGKGAARLEVHKILRTIKRECREGKPDPALEISQIHQLASKIAAWSEREKFSKDGKELTQVH